MIATPPLALRNRLAELILSALGDAGARGELLSLASTAELAAPWLAGADTAHVGLVRRRARAASEALGHEPVLPPGFGLDDRLHAAAVLFDAGLHFEVHELLEPAWRASGGATREALQGLVQIAVGYQHLANGNAAGGRALLAEGAARLDAGALDGVDLRAFAAAVRASLSSGAQAAPRFPRSLRAA